MAKIEVISNVVTPFTQAGELDEKAYRQHADRMASAGIGLFVGSPGSGECHTLSLAEYRRVCELATETAGGRVPVLAMTPELHTVAETLPFAAAAVSAGVDEVQLFQCMGGHGMVPTRAEQLAYWHGLLDQIPHPVALSMHGIAGYLTEPGLLAELVGEYPSIKTVFMYQGSEDYLGALRGGLPERVRIGGILSVPTMLAGGTIVSNAEANVIPRTCRALADAFIAGDMAALSAANDRMRLVARAMRPWAKPNSRSLKMALRALGLLEPSTGVRPPLLMPPDPEVEALGKALTELGVPAWESY
jgi:4-hydroxy-tetrahydrodipicolinate synthase